jgi:phosphatidylinositol glycan class S
VFNFSIESQILYHAPLSFEPTYGPTLYTDDGQVARAIEAAQGGDQRAEEVAAALIDDRKGDEAWLIDEEMMKVFVNSERWSLGELSRIGILGLRSIGCKCGVPG